MWRLDKRAHRRATGGHDLAEMGPQARETRDRRRAWDVVQSSNYNLVHGNLVLGVRRPLHATEPPSTRTPHLGRCQIWVHPQGLIYTDLHTGRSRTEQRRSSLVLVMRPAHLQIPSPPQKACTPPSTSTRGRCSVLRVAVRVHHSHVATRPNRRLQGLGVRPFQQRFSHQALHSTCFGKLCSDAAGGPQNAQRCMRREGSSTPHWHHEATALSRRVQGSARSSLSTRPLTRARTRT